MPHATNAPQQQLVDNFLSCVYQLTSLQEKPITAFFERNPEARGKFGEFLSLYRPVWESPEIGGLEALAAAYSRRMVGEYMMCRMDFMRTGTYALASQDKALELIYNNPEQMLTYMLGHAISQYLWQTHYELSNFFKHCVDTQNLSGRFLEIGSGAGLNLHYLMGKVTTKAIIDVVDISESSIKLAKTLLATLHPEAAKRVRFTLSDIAHYEAQEPYDFIAMGEVLEHVDDPASILRGIKKLLSENGSLFISTCANCPAPDHVYLFRNIDEIRNLIRDSGYTIAHEVVIPSLESKSLEYHITHKLDISYGALLKKTKIHQDKK